VLELTRHPDAGRDVRERDRNERTFAIFSATDMKRSAWPVALTIAGSDSGGGAGVQTDLKTFAAWRCHGTSAITCLTAQNPRQVTGIQPVRPDMVRAQLRAIFAELPVGAAKTGMLFSAGIIKVVAEWWAADKRPPLVVDPVMVATSGAVLLKPSAIHALKERLLPQACLITPNLDEAQLLLGGTLRTLADLRAAAVGLHDLLGCAALVKGGHLDWRGQAVDVLFDGRRVTVLRARRIPGVSTHGTGCTYSAAITAHLARGAKLLTAVRAAKRFVTDAIAQSYRIGAHLALQPGAPGK